MTFGRVLRNLLRAAAGLAVSAVAVWLVLGAVDAQEVGDAIGRAGWTTVLMMGGVVVLDIVARAMRWRAVLMPLEPVSRAEVVAHTFIGYLANTALPARLGEVVRSYTLGTRAGISKATVGGTIVIERMLDVASLAVISAVALTVTPAGRVLTLGIGLAAALCLLSGGMLVLATGHGLRRRVAERIRLRQVPERLRPAVAVAVKLAHGLSVVRSPRAMAEACAWSLIAWLVTGVGFMVAAQAVGIGLSVPQVALFVAATNLVTVIPAGPAYVGTFELAAVSAAAALGLPAAGSLAVAVLMHVVIVTVTAAGGLVATASIYLLPGAARLRPELVVERADPRD